MTKDILKKVFIGVCIGVILLFVKSCNVKAIANDTLGTYISETGMFLSLNSNNQTTQRGYSLINGSDLYYALPSGQPFTYGTYGGSITQCDIPVVANNYYALTYYFISNDTYSFHPDYSSFGYKVGVNSTWLNTIPTFSFTSVSGANQFSCISGFNSPFGDCISSFTGIFKAPSNNTCVTMAFSSASHDVTTTEVAFVGYTYESLGNEPLTQSQITNIITNANQQVINNITNSTTSINNNSNNNRDLIIANQNQNTQDLIENNNQNFNSCSNYNYTKNNFPQSGINGYLQINGNISYGDGITITDYIPVNKNSQYSLTTSSNDYYSYCLYDINKNLISCTKFSNISNPIVPINDGYIRYSVYPGFSQTNFTGEYCKNRIDETNDKLNDLNNNLVDESGPQLGGLNNSAGWLPAGPVDSILNLPLSLLNNLSTNLSKSCSPAVLNIPYVNSQITLPCMTTIYEQMGLTSWINTIGIIASAFILFSYLAKLYKWVDDTLTFRENNHIDNWGGV